MKDTNNLGIYELLRDSYNGASFEEFCELLNPDVVYESQWVTEPMIGKDKVANHLIMKSKTIRETNSIIHAYVTKLLKREIKTNSVNLMYKEGRYCVEVNQGQNKMIILLDIKDGMISRIDLCMPELFNYELVEYPNHMTRAEIHSFGIEIVANLLVDESYCIDRIINKLGRYPQIIAKKDDIDFMIIVHTEVAPYFGRLDDRNHASLVNHAARKNAKPLFASVSIGSHDMTNFNKGIALRGEGFHVSFQGMVEVR